MTHHRDQDINWREISIEEILEFAIADEEEARDYYKRAAECAGASHTRRMLLNLSAMEQEHADKLRNELRELQAQRDLEVGIAD